MGTPAHFPGANRLFRAPAGAENVSDLETFSNGNVIVSAWQLSPAELEAVNASGGIVFLSVFSSVLFPVCVGSEDSIRMLAADFGPVWKREGRTK